MADLYHTLIELRERGEPAALATVIEIRGSVPGSECMKILVDRQGRRLAGSIGGGCVEAEVLDAAREVIAEERPRLLEFSLTEEETGEEGLICGGTVRIFLEPVVAPSCVIFGGGHVGKAVAKTASQAGFRVVVVDDREAFANRERFDFVDECHVGPFVSVAEQLAVGSSSYLVIVTRGHAYDRELLRWAVGTSARYIGMIGSRRKVLESYRALVADGLDHTLLERVHAPIGLDIGAVTSSEIAVAVAAELIEVRRRDYRPPRSGPRRPYSLLLEEL